MKVEGSFGGLTVPRRTWIAAAFAVATFSCLLYVGTLRNGFVYDDIPQVLKNPWIRDPWSLLRAFTMGSWAYEGTASNYYRPVMHVVYTATYVLFGLSPTGFHAVSIGLNAIASVLVLGASSSLLAQGSGSDGRRLALAAAAALLFASHPIHAEAVAWIGGIPDLCCALFCLSCFWSYAAASSDRGLSLPYVASLGLFLLATLSKEIALVFPLVLLAYDLAFRRARLGILRGAGRYLGFASVTLLYLLLRWNALGGLAPVRRHPEIVGGDVVLNALPLFAAYLRKLALPLDLSAFYAFQPVTSWGSTAALVSIAVAAGFAIAGLVLCAKGAASAFVAWAMVIVPLLPTLYIPGVGENPFAERYLYLPSVGFVWLLVVAASRLRPPAARMAVAACGALLVAVWTAGVLARVTVWESDLTLWQDAVVKSPEAPIAHYNLGAALLGARRFDPAVKEFETAVRLSPSPLAWTSLGTAYREAGRPGEAVLAFRAALSMDPRLEAAYDGLGLAYIELGQPGAALEPLGVAVGLAPGSAVARHTLAYAYERLGMIGAAIQGYEEALRADPSDAAARQRLARLLRDRGAIIGPDAERRGR